MLGVAACDSPTAPPPPPPDAPSLTCPAPITAESATGTPISVPFLIPSAVNGAAPVTVTCSHTSGASFSPGSTVVTCTAVDALARQATCNFNITVTIAPRIAKTRFLAFGDSITFGRCGPKPGECPPYTFRLAELLRARYHQQNIAVYTSGVSGEKTDDGEDRLPRELDTFNPEVLLLMEGTNDIIDGSPDLGEALESIEDMIELAQKRGIAVYVATIPPIAPGGPNNSAIPRVAPFNGQIRTIALRRKAILVDVYGALSADIPRYYVGDDLHPTAEGLRLIGETFYAPIRDTLDITPGGGALPTAASLFELITDPARARSRNTPRVRRFRD
jgi:lysophospholipase L1-like esterase